MTTETTDPLVAMCMRDVTAWAIATAKRKDTAFNWTTSDEEWERLQTRIELALAKARRSVWLEVNPLLHAVSCMDSVMDQFELYEPWYAVAGGLDSETKKIAALEARLEDA